ncbi:hypothetical protein D3C76_1879900 [compost metagenome]
MLQHLVHQQTGIPFGANAEELAFWQGDVPALRTSGFGLFVVQDANQQTRLGVVHMLLNPGH